MNKSDDSRQPGWLQRVQEQSWEPELLISGLVLFALFQVPELIDAAVKYMSSQGAYFFSNSTIDEALGAMLKVSVYVLIAGFTAHIFLRSIWVAYAGLSYLYKDGINFSELKLPDLYAKEISKMSYEDKVKKLEKVCSGMFSLSFMFFMIVLGFINLLLIISVVVYITYYAFSELANQLVINALMIIGLLYIIDLLTLGLLRKIPYLRVVYYPFHRFARLVMLAPLYEDIYYGFVTNNKKWKIGLLTLSMGAVIISGFIEIRVPGALSSGLDLRLKITDQSILYSPDSDKNMLYSGHYEDRAEKENYGSVIIPSDIIRDNVLRVFVSHTIANEFDEILDHCNGESSDKSRTNSNQAPQDFTLECLNKTYRIGINDSLSTSKGLFQYNSKLDLYGLVYWQDISDLSRGVHKLTAYRLREFDDDSLIYKQTAVVEFYKDSPKLSAE